MQRFQRHPRHESYPHLCKQTSISDILQRFIYENTRTKFILCSPSTLPEPDAVPNNVSGLRGGVPVSLLATFFYSFQVVIILIDGTTLSVLHPSLPCLPCASHIAPCAALTEQQLADMKLADMRVLLALALNGRCTQPTDTGAKHFVTHFLCSLYLRG